MSLEFNLGMHDLAMTEVHIDYISKVINDTIDEATETLGKMDIELESIKVPNMKVMAKISEYSENFKREMNRLQEAIANKKAELIKTEQDESAYASAYAEAKAIADQDLAAISKQGKKKVSMTL